MFFQKEFNRLREDREREGKLKRIEEETIPIIE
jgi:hypothetical protein